MNTSKNNAGRTVCAAITFLIVYFMIGSPITHLKYVILDDFSSNDFSLTQCIYTLLTGNIEDSQVLFWFASQCYYLIMLLPVVAMIFHGMAKNVISVIINILFLLLNVIGIINYVAEKHNVTYMNETTYPAIDVYVIFALVVLNIILMLVLQGKKPQPQPLSYNMPGGNMNPVGNMNAGNMNAGNMNARNTNAGGYPPVPPTYRQ